MIGIEDPHRLVEGANRSWTRTAGGGSLDMECCGRGDIHYTPPGVFDPPRPVEVFAVHEVALVEEADLINELATEHEERPTRGIDLRLAVFVQIGEVVLAKAVAAREEPRQQGEPIEGTRGRRERAAAGKVKPTVLHHQTSRRHSHVMVLVEVRYHLHQRIGLHDRVRVQQQQILAVSKPEPLIRRDGEARVALVANQLRARIGGRDRGWIEPTGRIVHDDRLDADAPAAAKRGEAADEQFRRLSVDYDDGNVRLVGTLFQRVSFCNLREVRVQQRSHDGAPMITVSLVTFNGIRWLPGCLASVKQQALRNFELLVLDNASTDGTGDWLREQLPGEPRMRLIQSAENLGYAVAHNRHIVAARGEFLLLLNQDVQLDAGYLTHAFAAFDGRPRVGAVQGRLRQLGQDGSRLSVMDSTGLEMHRDRRVVARRQGEVERMRDLVPGPVWGADGPAPVFRRSALMATREPRTAGGWEVLDEDFFMYKEDVDLAWRLRRGGWQTWYEPAALGWHARGAGVGATQSWTELVRSNWRIPSWIKAVSWRNQRLMQVKNDRATDLLVDLPWIARREILSLAFVAVVDRSRLRAIPQLVARLRPMARKRLAIRGRGVRRVVGISGPCSLT